MTGTAAYLLLKSKIKSVATGITGVSFNDNRITFTFQDGKTESITVPLPEDGISITTVGINEDNHLICTLSDGSTVDAGEIPVAQGSGLSQVANFDSLPLPGNSNILYLTLDTKILYYWDGMQYQKASSGIDDIGLATQEDIDSLFENAGEIEDVLGLASEEDIDSLFT